MRVRRILEMGPEEVADRLRQAASKRLSRLTTLTGPARPRARIQARLRRGLDTARAVHEMFFDELPRRFFPGATAEGTPKLVWHHAPNWADAVIHAANATLAGRFDVLGYRGLSFGNPIDWRLDPVSGRRSPLVHWNRLDVLDPQQVGDCKVVWELGRQQWVIHLAQAYQLTGEVRYATGAVRAIVDWLEANPPELGIHWTSSLEVAYRMLSWLWTLALCQGAEVLSPAILLHILDSIDRHACHVERYLSRYSSPNTHLTGEALGLFAVGVTAPELKDATRWRDLGARILVDEVTRQIRPDGTQFEQATIYHRYTAEIYLQFLVLAAHNALMVPAHVSDRVERLLEALVSLRWPDGSLPVFGDADGGWLFPQPGREPVDPRGVLAIGAALFGRSDMAWAAEGVAPEAAWLLGASGARVLEGLVPTPPSLPASRALHDGGYAVLRSDWGPTAHQLVLDAGPLGDPVTGAHGHADLLAVQVVAFGVPAVIDPGTGCYTADLEWRNHFRSTPAHSTLTLDGQGQAWPTRPFAWSARPAARLRSFRLADTLEIAEGEHDAYALPSDAVRHRRRVLFVRRAFWVMVDDLSGSRSHAIDLRLQLAELTATLDGDGWTRVRLSEDKGLLIRAWANAPLEPRLEDAWISPDYGCWVLAPMLVHAATTRLPFRAVTLLWPTTDVDGRPPEVIVRTDPAGVALGLSIPGVAELDLGRVA